jgi:hypothetical protein
VLCEQGLHHCQQTNLARISTVLGLQQGHGDFVVVLFPTEQFVVVIVGLQTNDVHYEVDVEMPFSSLLQEVPLVSEYGETDDQPNTTNQA